VPGKRVSMKSEAMPSVVAAERQMTVALARRRCSRARATHEDVHQ
jgi:hypothetical protein